MPYRIQKHIPLKHLDGSIFINKCMLADVADLIRTSPTAARVLILFLAYADDMNSIITDVKSVAKLLGVKKDEVKYAINKLLINGYIEMKEVKLNHNHKIIGVVHDIKEYRESKKKQWIVVGEKLVTDFTLTGTYNRFIIDFNIAKCTNSGCGNNLLTHIKGNLFYDTKIDNNEIIWEL